MKILWYNTFASFVGGCERYIHRAASMLKEHSVSSALMYDPSCEVDDTYLEAFEESYPLNTMAKAIDHFQPDIIFAHQIENAPLKKLLNSAVPVVRFFHDYETFCLKGIKLRPFTNEPCTSPAGCRCYPFGCQLVRSPSGIQLRTLRGLHKGIKLHQLLDGYCVPSNYVKEVAIESGLSESKIQTIHPMVPKLPETSRNRHVEKGLILYIGQLLRGKGVDLPIKALKLLPEPYRLVIIGTGRKEKEYRKLTAKLGLENRVTFTGFLSQEEIANYHNKAEMQVVPSRHPDPFPTVGPEAMRYGIPIIGSRLGGIPEWLEDGKTGILVPHNDPEAIAKAAIRISKDQELIESANHMSKVFVEKNCSPEVHIESLLTFFRSILSKRKKYTQRPSEKGNRIISEILDTVKAKVKDSLPENSYRALILFGGYGRGEGGLLNDYPHNNMDFLLITKDRSISEEMFRQIMTPISEKYKIGFDLSVISEGKLRMSHTHLIWYEMFHGHKLLLGDPCLIHSLPFRELKNVPPGDFKELLVNRGTLFIINQLLLRNTSDLSEMHKKVFIKHMMKAIIGFGDAKLYTLGQYHWSYEERLKRIKGSIAIDEPYKKMYAEAAEFRFQPSYEKYMKKDFHKWLKEAIECCTPIYLEFEKHRLNNPYINWNNYPEKLLKQQLSSGKLTKKIKGTLQVPRKNLGKTLSEKIAFWSMTPAERLGLIFPYVGLQAPKNAFFEKAFASQTPYEIEKNYLREWSEVGDRNFFRSAKEWGLNLEASE